MARKTALFVTYGGGHAPMLLPVVKALREEDVEVSVLALTMAGPFFERAGIPCLSFRHFTRGSDAEALRRGEAIAAAMHAEHTGIPREESVAYLGLSYQDLADRLGPDEAERRFREEGRMAFEPVSILERVFDRVRPDVLVTTNSPRAEAAARLVARERNVPIVAVTDLLGTFIRPMDVDILCVSCRSAARRYFASPMIRASEIHVVGNPAMDASLDAQGPPDPAWMRSRFPGAPADRPFVLLAEQLSWYRPDGVYVPWTPAEIRENLDRVYRCCRDLGATLLVRPHPSLPPDLYAEWIAGRAPGSAYLARREELHPLLRSCGVLISNYSTIMLDALYLGRPVLLVRYPGASTPLPFDEMGFALSAPMPDPDALRDAVRAALWDAPAARARDVAFRAEFPLPPSAPRIADLVRSRLVPAKAPLVISAR